MAMFNRKSTRERLHERLRKKVNGTPERPRLSVYFSNQHIVAQVIDDSKGVTLASASTREKNESTKGRANVAGAKVIGSIVAERAKARGIEAVVFDRGGHVYHGKVKALADAAREAGLKF